VSYDTADLGAAIFNRAALDTQGVGLRNYLVSEGASIASIMHAQQLRVPASGDTTIPQQEQPRPILAYRAGPVTQMDRQIDLPYFWWWIYDDSEQGYWRINKVVTQLKRIYIATPRIRLVGSAVGPVEVTDTSLESSDPSLDLLFRYVTLSLRLT
jgi:hypothetical protein